MRYGSKYAGRPVEHWLDIYGPNPGDSRAVRREMLLKAYVKYARATMHFWQVDHYYDRVMRERLGEMVSSGARKTAVVKAIEGWVKDWSPLYSTDLEEPDKTNRINARQRKENRQNKIHRKFFQERKLAQEYMKESRA